MQVKSRVPEDFYKLFSGKYTEYYQLALIALSEESAASSLLTGLTEEDCQDILRERMSSVIEEDGGAEEEEGVRHGAGVLRRLVAWGWLKRDFDEMRNSYVISVPDYSQMFIDVFRRLFDWDSRQERGSILAVYSHLFTYRAGAEKNNDLLNGALEASKALRRMLSDLQEGMRGYFEALAEQKTFLGVQEVLVGEINNRDSGQYAILTTTDSFYRYKEEIRELLDQNIAETAAQKQALVEAAGQTQENPEAGRQRGNERSSCEEALGLLFRIAREFEEIEKRYNRLIDQKRMFAKRAAARMRYILAEGDAQDDQAKEFVRFLEQSPRKEQILEDLAGRLGLTGPFRILKEKSFFRPRNTAKREFCPQEVQLQKGASEGFDTYVVKPLYTQAQIAAFRREHETDGVFCADAQTVRGIEDLEKLLFVWQEAAEDAESTVEAETEKTFTTPEGFRYSGFSVRRKREDGSLSGGAVCNGGGKA